MNTQFSCLINASIFELVARVASTEETRYYLNGVYVEPHPIRGVKLTATDGHRLLHAWDETGTCKGSAIVRLSKPGLTAARFKAKSSKVLSVADGVASVVSFNTTRFVSPTYADILTVGDTTHSTRDWYVDGTFPDYQRVIPTGEPEMAVASFNSDYIADLGAIATTAGKVFDTAASMIVIPTGNNPARVSFSTEKLIGVIMPMRAASPHYGDKPPMWFSARKWDKPAISVLKVYETGRDDKPVFVIPTVRVDGDMMDPIHRNYTFPTREAAERVRNRLLARLHAKGIALDSLPSVRMRFPAPAIAPEPEAAYEPEMAAA